MPPKIPAPLPRREFLTRRELLAASGTLGLGALLAGCGGSDGDGPASDSGRSGAWTFRDDRGKTARSERLPKRIVAYVGSAAALFDYGIECSGIFGPSEPVRGEPNPQAGDLDVKNLPSLGTAWGQFNLERYAALKPELLVSNMFPPPDLWFVPGESAEEILSLAPSIGIKTSNTSLLAPLRQYERLAAALGADLDTDEVTSAKARFREAEKTLRQAAKARRGLKVMAVTGDTDNMYVAIPDSYVDLRYFKDLGVEFVEGNKSDKWGFWEFLSWENADKYHADLLMVDNREQALTSEQLMQKATWRDLPAIRAKQTVPWAMEERYSYQAYVPVLERLASAVRRADELG